MKRIAIGGGAYEERGANGRATGRFWARPRINRRLTWKLLKASGRRAAIAEISKTKFAAKTDSFAALTVQYLKAGCPTRKRKWRQASPEYQAAERAHITQLCGFFGHYLLRDIRLAELHKYHDWRRHGQPPGKLTRMVDKELQTLSNVMNYAVFITEQIDYNPVRSNRPHFHTVASHARDRMPPSADVIHALADKLFSHPKSEVFGWLALFSMFTGCRQSELLRLKMNAKEQAPGHIIRTKSFPVPEHKAIYRGVGYLDLGRRSKQQNSRKHDGENPECIIWPEFMDMIDSFLYWHKLRYPECEHFFPGLNGVSVVENSSFGHALVRVMKGMDLPHITPHGFRSYFATKLHRDGFRDEDIAEKVGDKTVALMSGVYRDRVSGSQLSWLPSKGLAAWLRFRPAAEKLIRLKK